MRIKKHGTLDKMRHVTFKCHCGCKFEADINEYREYSREYGAKPCTDNDFFKSERVWECECPECGETVQIRDASTYTVDEMNRIVERDGEYWRRPDNK